MTEPSSLDPAGTALLLIEVQRQWTEKGLFHTLVSRQLHRRGVMPNILRIAERVRASGGTVVHAPMIVDPAALNGLFAKVTRGRLFRAGSPAAEISPGVLAPGDLVLTDRIAFDAFAGSSLEKLLRHSGITQVLLCGFTTDQCIRKTLRSALKAGFDARLVSDGTADVSPLLQLKVEKSYAARTLRTSQVLELLGPG